MVKPKLLIVEDDEGLCSQYRWAFPSCDVLLSHNRQQAVALAKRELPPVVIMDLGLPPDPDGVSEGFATLAEILRLAPKTKVVIATGNGAHKNALQAISLGAYDFCEKTVEIEVLRTIVERALNLHRLEEENRRLAGAPARSPIERIITASSPMLKVCRDVEKLATTNVPVLLLGESGTGKEALAAALHQLGPRAKQPFVAINCGAIPENLLEAEFFGARKGAYTGATQDRLGLFQTAKGGTLFLDEIGDLPLAMQSKLLRAIQERTVRPLGSAQEDAVDVRIVSATHKDLAAGVAAGLFRQDLYYRLNVIEITVPALRERLEDLPTLCDALLARICHESGLFTPGLAAPAMDKLRSLPFNGNVRELENILHRAVALAEGGALHFDAQPEMPVAVPENLQDFLDGQERSILSRVLQESGFNRTAAAARLGLSLRQIRYRIVRLGIVTPGHDDAAEPLDEQA